MGGGIENKEGNTQQSELQKELEETTSPVQFWVTLSWPGASQVCSHMVSFWHQSPEPVTPWSLLEGLSTIWPLEGVKACKSAGRHHSLSRTLHSPNTRAGRRLAVLLPVTPQLLAVLPCRSRALRPREKKGSPAPFKQSVFSFLSLRSAELPCKSHPNSMI